MFHTLQLSRAILLKVQQAFNKETEEKDASIAECDTLKKQAVTATAESNALQEKNDHATAEIETLRGEVSVGLINFNIDRGTDTRHTTICGTCSQRSAICFSFGGFILEVTHLLYYSTKPMPSRENV